MARNPYFPWKSVPSVGIHSLFKAENAGFGLVVLWQRCFAGGGVDRGRSVITRRDDADFVPIPLPNPQWLLAVFWGAGLRCGGVMEYPILNKE